MIGVVGIDLGTTYSVVAHLDENEVPEVIPDETGGVLVPSVISFAGEFPVVGADAKAALAAGETEVAAVFKRNMGDPSFLMSFAGRDYDATDLSALVLAKLKAQAEQFTNTTITQAVVTVPAYFTHPQRTATIAAGEQAGLEVLKIISEPTAAALAYGMRPNPRSRHVLVYDLGGGTFDVSLVEVTSDELRVIATDGDHKLGGRDWDDRLVVHLLHRFRDEFGVDVADDDAQTLLVRAEGLKHTLSARRSADILVESGGHHSRYTVTRADFEELTRDLLDRTEQLTHQVLVESELDWSRIDGVVPVGGATRMPMVRGRIERMSGRPPIAGAHPDQAVAVGAALTAAAESHQLIVIRTGQPSTRLPGLRLGQDVIAHSLGMIAENADGTRYVNSVLIRKNLPIPAKQQRPYRFRVHGTGENLLEIFLTQGETDDPRDCAYLGRYVVTGFGPGDGPTVVDIGYEYDHNGVVHVSAVDNSTTRPLLVTIDAVPPNVAERFLDPPPTEGRREHATVYLAIDLSGSMSGHPLAESQRAAREFARQCDLSRTSVGLIGFSDEVELLQAATQNTTELEAAIRRLRVGATGVGNAGDPFDALHELMGHAPGLRYAVVLADGVWYDQDRAVDRARRCHESGIETIAIGFGDADRDFLLRIASSSEQGLFTDLSRLTEAFGTIAQELTENAGGRVGLRAQQLRA